MQTDGPYFITEVLKFRVCDNIYKTSREIQLISLVNASFLMFL